MTDINNKIDITNIPQDYESEQIFLTYEEHESEKMEEVFRYCSITTIEYDYPGIIAKIPLTCKPFTAWDYEIVEWFLQESSAWDLLYEIESKNLICKCNPKGYTPLQWEGFECEMKNGKLVKTNYYNQEPKERYKEQRKGQRKGQQIYAF